MGSISQRFGYRMLMSWYGRDLNKCNVVWKMSEIFKPSKAKLSFTKEEGECINIIGKNQNDICFRKFRVYGKMLRVMTTFALKEY